jgi:hypothetical protein
MIVFELQCGAQHRFEGWFTSAGDFDGQKAAGLVSCPVCGDHGIDRVPTARIQRAKDSPSPPAPARRPPRAQPSRQITPEMVAAFVDHAVAHSEDVGERFPEEARRIHHGEAEQRAVRGVASLEATVKLLEEGIPVMPLPVPAKKEWH